MKLRAPLPPDRTVRQLENHFEVERAIASRLKQVDRMERTRIYRTMYHELFEKVPDHPRLKRRDNSEHTAAVSRARLRLLNRFINSSAVVVEFGPGDCRFSYELCRHVKSVYGVDLSDQRRNQEDVPDNFRLLLYDGYSLELEDNSVDVCFSDQLIEHLHPEDTALHFEMVRSILKDGGIYVFCTPHKFTGPHDISKYFCKEAEGFHLKEWTYAELMSVLRGLGYRSPQGFTSFRSRSIRVPVWCFLLIERLLGLLPGSSRRTLGRRMVGDICLAALR